MHIGARVVVLNVILINLSVFQFFHFFKDPKWVIHDIIKLQRAFLWGGRDLKKNINWVIWSTIFKSKKQGGLEVKKCEKFNLVLLSKWKWRVLSEPNSFWFKILSFRYGVVLAQMLDYPCLVTCKTASFWWKYLVGLTRSVLSSVIDSQRRHRASLGVETIFSVLETQMA